MESNKKIKTILPLLMA